MALLNGFLSLFLLAGMTFAQYTTMEPMCTSASYSRAKFTLVYTEFQAPQVSGTSTVFDTIMTEWYNIVDCNVGPGAVISQVQANPPYNGPYTARTTSPTLTISAIGCMPVTTAIMRRDFRGFDNIEKATRPSESKSTDRSEPMHHSRPTDHTKSKHLPGHGHRSESHVFVPRQSDVPTTLSPVAAQLISQLQTAEYGLELCNSPLNLTEACNNLRTPAAIPELASVGLDAVQAGDIVCFCSVYGLDLNSTNPQLLGEMAAAIYGIDIGDGFTNTTNTTVLCDNVGITALPYLGVDSVSVNQFICSSGASSTTVTSTTTETVIVVPSTSSSSTFTITASTGIPSGVSNGTSPFSPSPDTSGWSGTGAWSETVGTGGPNPYGNATATGTGASFGTAASGTGNLHGNATGVDTESLGIALAQETTFSGPFPASGPLPLNSPLTPSSPRYYPAFTTSTSTSTSRWGGYE